MANVRRAVRECFQAPDLIGAKSVLLGVSGGADSMALALSCQFELVKLGIEIHAVVVNHNLQDGSSEIAAQTVERLRELGIKDSFVVSILVSQSGQGPEAAAREARYEALEAERVRLGADFVVTGHNLDDQAETVLLGLTRGSGLRSISGMREVDGKLIRPLLGISKAELREACADSKVDYWEDPHNQDPKFTRVRIRQLMDQIEDQLGPGVPAALARTAELAAEAEEFLTAAASELIASAQLESGAYLAAVFENSNPALRRKALQLIAIESGAKSISRAQVLSVEQLIVNWHGQKPLHLSGITVERVRDQILFRQSS